VYSFAEMLPALASAGYRAVAIDLPGHGLSDKPADESAYTTRALGDAVLTAAAALGIARFRAIGHSMGGGILLDLALRERQAIEALLLINAIGLGTPRAMSFVKLLSPRLVNHVVPAMLTRPVVEGILRVAFATRERPSARDVDEYWAPTQFREFARACRACVHEFSWQPVPEESLRALRLPVLVLIGDRDHVVRSAAARALHIPDARIVTIAGAGHLVQQECGDRTNHEVIGFLRGG
jgi:pimeloyl-ACP methyl ester carboxylesterase